MRNAFAILLLAAGCSMGGSDSPPSDSNTNSDSNQVNDAQPVDCAITIEPAAPVASSTIPILAKMNIVNPVGPPTYTWSVMSASTQVPYTIQDPDGSKIAFFAPTAGPYTITVNLTNVPDCQNFATRVVNVTAPGANQALYRLRVVPSPNVAPPQESAVQIMGGANAIRDISLDPGVMASGAVRNSATTAGVTAYLKFSPSTTPFAISETFSSSSGAYSLRLLPMAHQVLVIPAVPGLAPKLVTWTPSTTDLMVGPGTVVTGTVRGPGGAGFAGAKVQLYAGGVPSTIGTTIADGSYSVRTDFPTSATQVTVKVTPPAASGLPRLEATSAFNLTSAINVSYAASLATCDLANVPVRRGGVVQANAQVSVVGSLAITAGTIAGVNATNTVRVSATADGAGRLPAMLVPRGSLSAVTELSMTDHAVSAIDTSACSVAQVDAPAMTTVNGTTKTPANAAIDGIRVEAEPTGVLALAGVAAAQVTSNASGAFALPLAGGGRYNVRFFDPKQRVAPLDVTDAAPAAVPTNAMLAKALLLGGSVKVLPTSDLVPGASVQLLCSTCNGVDVTRPITETASTSAGRYEIAVPDPGTM